MQCKSGTNNVFTAIKYTTNNNIIYKSENNDNIIFTKNIFNVVTTKDAFIFSKNRGIMNLDITKKFDYHEHRPKLCVFKIINTQYVNSPEKMIDAWPTMDIVALITE
ncbi:hypothetical protein LbFV_ORF72 [Leptopilina boulardi filamentous virus]|uniref:Uncharacterized protein n=1 Tax=Leptopilina boulardi filamentous virus TaxID=552509 RepID=A0A1S5YD39_9VIRU|nr:hypothetical protein LbFV_ORF72 [Leptopilina boulardi filamentous virus]AQQ79992.1 hypothetical protein LbFV_ORF72 [Leptopilina boulardi filamentous virus]